MGMSTEELLDFYQSAFKSVANYAYLLDSDGHLIACNDRLLKILKLETITNHSVGIIYTLMLDNLFGNQRQLAQHKKLDIEALVSEKPTRSEQPVEFRLNNEKAHWFDVIRSPINDASGKPAGLMVELIEVTHTLYLKEQLEKIRLELAHKNKKAAETLAFSSTPASHKANKNMLEQESPLVLVIEDDEIAQKAAKSVLMHCNFDVHLAHDETEFDDMFEPGKYRLVFMDIGLEDTSGYIIAKSIRKQENNTEFCVPIIALTGYDPKNLTGDCDYYSMEGAIQKPLTIEQAAQINQRYIRDIDINITGLELAKPNE